MGSLHKSLAGSTSFKQPPVFDMEEIAEVIDKDSSTEGSESKTGFYREKEIVSLHDLALSIENRKPILSIPDSIAQIHSQVNDFSSWRNVLIIFNTVATFICVSVVLFIIYKV